MDLSCIISSGDLELYVLGMLSSEDASKIEQLAKLFPEIKAELDEIEAALLQAANEAEEAPSPSVKDALFSRLKDTSFTNDTTPPVINTVTPIAENKVDDAKVIPMYQPKRNSGLMAAAVIGILLAIGALAYTFINSNKQQAQIAAAQSKADSLQSAANAQQQKLSEYANAIQFYQDTNYTTINLLPAPNRPKDILVQVFWNKQTKAVYANNISLPQAPAGKQYQLWAFVNGKPVSAGLFDERKGVIEQMTEFGQPQAFAITLENAGGVTSPTLDQLYVIGNI